MSNSNSSKRDIHVVIVLPFLNEQATLYETCRSLAFGTGLASTPYGTTLVLIDNDSDDNSVKIAKEIQSTSRGSSVIIDREIERGYVPPRHRGNLVADHLCRKQGWDRNRVLILQADADVQYSENYIEEMRRAANYVGENTLYEGCVTYPTKFREEHSGFFELCDRVDSEFEKFYVSEQDDVLVVDHVSGYYLSDYFKWGEHQREYTVESEEIHAETTRLYLRARGLGASRFRVETVQVFHSPRKLVLDPGLHFACAGFPRETSWREKWHKNYKGPDILKDFYNFPMNPEVQKAAHVRQQHLMALLALLPLHVKSILTNTPLGNFVKLNTEMVVPSRTVEDLQKTPGKFIIDAFHTIEDREGGLPI